MAAPDTVSNRERAGSRSLALAPPPPLSEIDNNDDAVAAAARLQAIEDAFRAASDPAERRPLAREIIRLRAALTEYRLRSPRVPGRGRATARDSRADGRTTTSGGVTAK
jgi:hypothetical protein